MPMSKPEPKPESREYSVRKIARLAVRAGHIPVEHREQFEKELLHDVEHAVRRFRSGMAYTLVDVMFRQGQAVRPAA